jgi:hypothetical protein
MQKSLIYVMLAGFPLLAIVTACDYSGLKKRTLLNYPGANAELFRKWRAAKMEASKRWAIIAGIMTAINLILFLAGIGVVGAGILFFILAALVVGPPSRQAQRLAREMGLTTKAVKYVKHPGVEKPDSTSTNN